MLVGSITCYLWWRAGEKKKQVWPLYGRFVLLVALSGLAGIVNSGICRPFPAAFPRALISMFMQCNTGVTQ
jgi:hypothetical protein